MPWLLDTVLVSELRKSGQCDPHVLAWQAGIKGQEAFISVITLNEVWFGILSVESRDPAFAARLHDWYAKILVPGFQDALLAVDRLVAEKAAELRQRLALSYNDALIAGTALVHGLTLATRNEADFAATGITLVNPWRP
jgi:predicted nucleic acid-binding protein